MVSQVRLFEIGGFSCRLLDGHKDTVLALDVAPDGWVLWILLLLTFKFDDAEQSLETLFRSVFSFLNYTYIHGVVV